MRDAHHDRLTEAAEGADLLTLWREHVHDVRRQTPEHAHGKVEAIGHRDIDLVSRIEGDRLRCPWLPFPNGIMRSTSSALSSRARRLRELEQRASKRQRVMRVQREGGKARFIQHKPPSR